ncbi:g5212 [Coccomyxa elongata]
MGMRLGHSDEPDVLWGPDTHDADREWRAGATNPEQQGTPECSQDTESQSVPAQHFLNGGSFSAPVTGVWAGQGDQHREAQPPAGYTLQTSAVYEIESSGHIAHLEVPAILSLLQQPNAAHAPKAHSQGTAATSVTRGSDDGSAQNGNRMGTAEMSAEGLPWPRRHRGKRALPVPDLDAIEDPTEMKLQRRLLKNRRTAAASRERKQKEMENLVAKVQALQADNKELKSMLEQRNAAIRTLSMELPAEQKLLPPPGMHVATSVYPGDVLLQRSFSVRPSCHGQPRHVSGSPGCLPGQPWPEFGQPQSRGGAAWNVVTRSLSLPDGAPAAAAPQRPGAVTRDEASLLPLSMPLLETVSVKSLSLPSGNLSSAEVNMAWPRGPFVIGHSSDAESGFSCGLASQSLHLSSLSTQPLLMDDFPMTCPVGRFDGQSIQGRAFSCPIPMGPTVEPAGGSCPSGQLLQPRFGSYPLHRRQMPVYVSGQPMHVTPGFPGLLAPTDPAGMDQIDLASFWHGFD